MNNQKFETMNYVAENIAKIAELLSNVVTEGKVNFCIPRTALGGDVLMDEPMEVR